MAKILIAEDEPDIRDLITFTLRFAGHEVVAANNGEDAVVMAKQELPDLVILDVRMPRMTGYEACAQIKLDERVRNVPVIFLSAKGQESEIQAGLQAGAAEYLLKPFAPDQLINRINSALGSKGRAAEKGAAVLKPVETARSQPAATPASPAARPLPPAFQPRPAEPYRQEPDRSTQQPQPARTAGTPPGQTQGTVFPQTHPPVPSGEPQRQEPARRESPRTPGFDWVQGIPYPDPVRQKPPASQPPEQQPPAWPSPEDLPDVFPDDDQLDPYE